MSVGKVRRNSSSVSDKLLPIVFAKSSFNDFSLKLLERRVEWCRLSWTSTWNKLRCKRESQPSKERRKSWSVFNVSMMYCISMVGCHDPDASGHGTCNTTVCYHIISLSTVPLVPLTVLIPHSGLIYDNTPFDLFQLCLVVSRLVVSAL